MHLFWRNGYQGTSMDDIEIATGLKKGSVYKAFDSKRDLFLKCLDHYMINESYKAILMRMVDRPLIESFSTILDMLIDGAHDDSQRPCGCLTSNLVSELSSVDQGLAEAAADELAGMQKAMEFRVSWAIQQGELSNEANPKEIAATMMVVLQGIVILSKSTKDVKAMRLARNFVIRVLEKS